MVGLKEICALLLAGGMGAGSVVAVQQAKPKPKVERKAPVAKKASAPAARTRLDDCPTMVSPPGGMLVPEFASSLPAPQVLGLLPPAPGGLLEGGGGSGGILPPGPGPGPGVPEPAAWAMMISGFGLVGVALRLRPTPADRAAPRTA